MDSIFTKAASALVLGATAMYASSAHAANEATSQAEARQLTEQFTPQAQYQLSKREAYAAYQEALQGCHQGGKSDRTCTQDAKKQLQQDLSDARQHMQGGTSMGSSGTGGSAESASGITTEPAR